MPVLVEQHEIDTMSFGRPNPPLNDTVMSGDGAAMRGTGHLRSIFCRLIRMHQYSVTEALRLPLASEAEWLLIDTD